MVFFGTKLKKILGLKCNIVLLKAEGDGFDPWGRHRKSALDGYSFVPNFIEMLPALKVKNG